MRRRRIVLASALFLALAAGGAALLASRMRGTGTRLRVSDVQITQICQHSAPTAQRDEGTWVRPGALLVTGALAITNRRSHPVEENLAEAELGNGAVTASCRLMKDGASLWSQGDTLEIPARGSVALTFRGVIAGPPRNLVVRMGRLGEAPLERIESGGRRFDVTWLDEPAIEKQTVRVRDATWDSAKFRIAIRNNTSARWTLDLEDAIGASDDSGARYALAKDKPGCPRLDLAPLERREVDLAFAAPGAGARPYLVLRSPLGRTVLRYSGERHREATSEASLAIDPTPDFAKIDAGQGPIYLFAHHHSAYYLIKKLQLEGRLPWRGNVLINFDSHSDAYIPFDVPNPEDRDAALAFLKEGSLPFEQKLERLRRFVKDKLSITTWVLPLIDDGSLDAYYYVLPKRYPLDLVEGHAAVEQLRTRWADAPDVAPGLKPPRIARDFVFDVVRDDTLPRGSELAGKPVIVTIDIDYFSCRWALAGEDEDTVRPATPQEIRSAIARVAASLKAAGITPAAIPICESPQYVPANQIPLIDEVLLAGLKQAGFGSPTVDRPAPR